MIPCAKYTFDRIVRIVKINKALSGKFKNSVTRFELNISTKVTEDDLSVASLSD